MKLPLRDGTFAKKAGGNAVALLHLLGHRQPDGERQSAADNSVAAIEAGGSVEQVHRPAAPVAAAFGLAVHLGHDRIHRHAAGESMAVLAIGRDHRVGWRQRLHRTDGDRLLADVEMHESADLLLLIKLGAFLLEAPDAHHRAQQCQQVLAVQMRLWRMGVAHDGASSRVERSPSGRPSSRARSRRRMILPLRVRGKSGRKAISFGATTGPRRFLA